MASYVAVKVYGPGHVVAYNYVANFHDGIDIETYGNPDGSAAVDGPKYPPQEYWDRRPVVDRLLQQLHDQLSRQPVRDRRRHAQRPRDAEHDDQLGVARVLQSAGDRRAGLLDRQHRLSPAGRIDAADQRIGGRALLQQHDPVGDGGAGHGERALAEQPDARRELGAGDLQRQHLHATTPRRTTTASGPTRAPSSRSSGTRRRRRALADYTGAGPSRRRSTRARFATLAEYRAGDAARISTACWWTTTSSSTCRGWTRRTAGPCRRSTRPRISISGCEPAPRPSIAASPLPNVNDGFAGSAPDLGALERGRPAPHYGPRRFQISDFRFQIN